METSKIRVFSSKLNDYITIDVDPSEDQVAAIAKTGTGTRMLVPDQDSTENA